MREKIEARQIAAAYYTAWTAGDFDEMMKWVADDVICETPRACWPDRDPFGSSGSTS